MQESLSLCKVASPQVSVYSDHGGPYILSLANLSTSYAASTSFPRNKIDLIDKRSFRKIQTLPGHDVSIASLKTANYVVGMPGRTLISSGRDGSVKIWDERTGSHAIKLTNMGETSRGILSCAVSPDGNLVAGGTEFRKQDSFILYWDPRQPAVPVRKHSSTHSDNITTLSFHPSSPSQPLLLSGSTDGLLTVSNPTEDDEDEATLYVGSWGASVSQAGWYIPNSTDPTLGIWAASDMETFSLWSNELDQQMLSDIRSPSIRTKSRKWVTNYLITCFPSVDEGLKVYVGSNKGDAALITPPPLKSIDSMTNTMGSWTLNSLWLGHHVGIVRSLLPDDENNVVITGGEDGKIHLWANPNPTSQAQTSTDNDMAVDTDGEMRVDLDTQSPASSRKRDRDGDDILSGKRARSQ